MDRRRLKAGTIITVVGHALRLCESVEAEADAQAWASIQDIYQHEGLSDTDLLEEGVGTLYVPLGAVPLLPPGHQGLFSTHRLESNNQPGSVIPEFAMRHLGGKG